MKIAGIICEYNPFHTGHAAHIAETRRLLGGDAGILCVMSGNFAQRGEPAILRKHARAEMAVRCGADLVVELPLPWATATAERFALGGISLLDAVGITDCVSFGSECGDMERLERLASALLSDEAHALIKSALETGISYAAARQTAAEKLLGGDAELLKMPNNILAIEYLKALRRLGSSIEPMTVGRILTEHDGVAEDGMAPASHLRGLMKNGEDISDFIPKEAMHILKKELSHGRAPVTMVSCEDALLYRLRTMTEGEYAALPDSSEGLWMRLMRYGRSEPTYSSVLENTKTKRYALSRIRRMIMAAFLGITSDMSESLPPYIRVLAFNSLGQEMLHDMKKLAKLPIITKPAAAKELASDARRVFELEARAGDIYTLMYPSQKERSGGSEWTTGPVVV